MQLIELLHAQRSELSKYDIRLDLFPSLQRPITPFTDALLTVSLAVTEAPTRCHSTEFGCSNGNCIRRDLVCDGYNNCGDGSDERNCPVHTTPGESDCFLTGCGFLSCDVINARSVNITAAILSDCRAVKPERLTMI